MEPTKKSESINAFCDAVAGGHGREVSIVAARCAICGESAGEFRNEISRREYRISGLCQVCQDSIFGED